MWAINIHPKARLYRHDEPIGRLNLFAFEIERLPEFSQASPLNPAYARHVCGDLNFTPISIGQNPRIEAGRRRAHLDMECAG